VPEPLTITPRTADPVAEPAAETLSPPAAGPGSVPVQTVLPAAVLWDMDGTLVDTEPYWIAAEHELVREHGGSWTHEDAMSLVGKALLESAEILQAHGVDLGAEPIVDYLVLRVAAAVARRVPWQPGALELLTDLAAAGVPCALVTMSYRSLTEALVAAAPAGVFGAVVAGDEVTHGKPHPEAYLRAAALLGVEPGRCVALEDSPPGIQSALASGARTIGIEVMVPVAAQPGLSRVASLVGLTLADLGRVAGGFTLDRSSTPA